MTEATSGGQPQVDATAALAEAGVRPQRAPWRQALRVARRKPLGAVAFLFIIAMAVVAIFANLIAPYDPYAFAGEPFESYSWRHPLGTDQPGRDLFSRIIFGARISMLVGMAVSFGAAGTGAVAGILAGYFRGAVDAVISRLVDAFLAFPGLVLALALVSILGPSVQNVIIAVFLPIAARAARVIRSSVLSVREQTYVEAARVIGCTDRRIMALYILPNVMAPIIILMSLNFGAAILIEASLSYLGLGPPPPTPTWGRMLAEEGRNYFRIAPWLTIWPGVAIALAVYSFNIAGDALRDILDPRLRGA